MGNLAAAETEHLERIAQQGYTVLESVIEPDLIGELNEALARLERDLGVVAADNSFEGRNTVRIYNLLARGEVFARVPVHPAVLPLVKGVLDGGCLLSSLSSIAIDSGEIAQPIHADDQLIPLPKPHPAVVCNTMWALTDFTEANGATRLVPASHLLDSPDLTVTHRTVAAEMPKGSVLVWNGSLWHGGGANTSGKRRTGIACNYCAGYIRQQENQQLGVPREIAATFDRKLARLCGYGTYNGLIGHIDKQDPIHLLHDDTGGRVREGDDGSAAGGSMVWDGI